MINPRTGFEEDIDHDIDCHKYLYFPINDMSTRAMEQLNNMITQSFMMPAHYCVRPHLVSIVLKISDQTDDATFFVPFYLTINDLRNLSQQCKTLRRVIMECYNHYMKQHKLVTFMPMAMIPLRPKSNLNTPHIIVHQFIKGTVKNRWIHHLSYFNVCNPVALSGRYRILIYQECADKPMPDLIYTQCLQKIRLFWASLQLYCAYPQAAPKYDILEELQSDEDFLFLSQ